MALLAVGKENPADVKKQFSSAKSASPSTAPAAAKVTAVAASVSSSPVSAPAVATLEEAVSGEVHEPDNAKHGATRSIVLPAAKSGGGNGHDDGRIRVSPLAKRIAADKGFDLAQITGTGPAGRIIQRDVINFTPVAPAIAASKAPAAAALAPRATAGAKTVIP